MHSLQPPCSVSSRSQCGDILVADTEPCPWCERPWKASAAVKQEVRFCGQCIDERMRLHQTFDRLGLRLVPIADAMDAGGASARRVIPPRARDRRPR